MTTSVFVQPTGRRVAPFDEPPTELLILDRRLGQWQDEAIAEAGLQRIDTLTPPCLVIPDTLFTCGPVLRQLVAGAAGRDAWLVLADGVFARNTTPVQPGVEPVEGGWRFEAVRFVSGRDDDPVDVVVDVDEHVHELELPAVFGGDTEIGLPRHPVMTLHHWCHQVWANQAAMSMVVRRTPWWRALPRLLWAVLRARSLNPWRVQQKLNRIGRGCDIHPTAVVEASTLGDNVTVGPFARVWLSHVGDGARILSGAEVEGSTVGAGATVGQRCGLRLCVIYPEAFASQVQMQACVLGRNSIAVPGSYSIDFNFDRDIRVPLDGELHSTGTRFLGSAFGHDCRVGTGIWLASGRSVPNGTWMVRDPREVVQRIGEVDAQTPVANRDGTLEPLDP
ncbi:MAG: hypothetical protein KTR31_20185 [Myxococcales bacterium]|nr:hypothetical protein [Myxococcales bacterium]